VPFYSTGKAYPGETNPRWAIRIIWNRDCSPLVPALSRPQITGRPTPARIETFKILLLRALRIEDHWLQAIDLLEPNRIAWALPLDHEDASFRSDDWSVRNSIAVLPAEVAAGLRLPLQLIPENASRRALTIEAH